MDRDLIRAALGNGQPVEHLLEGWDAIQASLPPDGRLFFLQPNYVAAAAEEAALDPGFAAALVAAAQRINADPVARVLAWQAHHRLKEQPQWGPQGPGGWPEPTALAGDAAPLLYHLALLGELPTLRAIHAAHSIPPAVHQATLHDLQRWADHYHRVNGTWGITSRHLPWYWNHLHGQLYELGRLQYQPGTWQLPVRAYRHTPTSALVALSDDGVRYHADGQRAGAGGVEEPTGIWTARLISDQAGVTGHAIAPQGYARRSLIHLPRAEWQEVLAPGSPVLHLHIPQGTPLDVPACGRSLAEAAAFFPLHFPDHPFVAFACQSWLLDAQLEQVLPATSNLVRFLRQMYLVPVVSDGSGAFYFTFDVMPTDLHQAPRDTTLRRALIDHVLAGGRWRGGGCFLFSQDLPAWDTDTYRGAPHSTFQHDEEHKT